MTERINDVDLTRHIRLEGRILEPVPEAERGDYKFWRAAHLGKIAMNFMRGEQMINAWQNPPIAHFTPAYQRAVIFAGELTDPASGRISQFTPADAIEFHGLTGLRPDFKHPAIIYGLKNDHAFDLELSEGFGGGWIYNGELTLDHIDPHSKQAILRLFDISPEIFED